MKTNKPEKPHTSVVSDFFHFFLVSMHGNPKYLSQNHRQSFTLMAAIMLVAWLALGALGTTRIYYFLANIQRFSQKGRMAYAMQKTYQNSKDLYDRLWQDARELYAKWEGRQPPPQPSSLPAPVQNLANNLGAILLLLLLLWGISKYSGQEAGPAESLITLGFSVMPLLIGVVLGYPCVVLADNVSSIQLAAVLCLICLVLLLLAVFTAFIVFHVGLAAVLKIKGFKRYLLTMASLVWVLAVFLLFN